MAIASSFICSISEAVLLSVSHAQVEALGKSRAAESASAMPSMIGIWMSDSRRSKLPSSRVRISSASAPSCAVTVACPSMPIARATSMRMDSSSSAIRTRAI